MQLKENTARMSNFKFQISNFKLISGGYFLILASLFLYSFTQIDLSLTLSRVSFVQGAEKWFQQIGFFQRPLSTEIYLNIIILLTIFYGLFIRFAQRQVLGIGEIRKLIGGTAIILLLSYNAFSYDLFNYIFDAKIIVHYNQNPYLHKALDFPGDPMLSFMHWTHRTFPYGPAWLVLTVPLVFLGFGYLIPTLILFKLLMAGAYIGSCYFLFRTLKKIKPEHAVSGLVVFALNPLVIIESLVSAHLDIVMIFFALWGIDLFIENKKLSSIILVLLSGAVKFATFILVPIMLLKSLNKKISWDTFFYCCLILTLATIIAASFRTNFQPWYLLTAIPFCSFFADKKYIVIPTFIISFFALLEYVPFIFNGNWNPPIPDQLQTIRITGILLSFFIAWLSHWKLSRK